MKRALVPLDFSDASGSVIRFVFPFARKHGLYHVDFLYVEEDDMDLLGDLLPQEETHRNDIRSFVEKEIDFTQQDGVSYNILSMTGDAEDEIADRAARMRYDLVIIGHHMLSGIEGLTRRLLGRGIMDQIPCSLLIYKPSCTRWMV